MVLVSRDRFIVRELSNGQVRVVDTVECFREAYVAPDQFAPMQRRQAAHAEARRLNDWDAHADAPLDFPRLRYGSEALL